MDRPWHAHYDHEVPTTIRYPEIPLHEIIEMPAAAYPDKPATVFFGTALSYKELRLQIRRFANALADKGVKQGDRVGIQLPNCPQYVIAYYATISLGAIVVNVNPLYTPDEIRLITEITGLTTYITFDMVVHNVRAAAKEVEIPSIIVTVMTDYIQGMPASNRESMDIPASWHHFGEMLDGCHDTRVPRVDIGQDDPCLIIFTGGTTGIPKGAIHTHRTMMAATHQFRYWGAAFGDFYPAVRRSWLATMPFFHSAGNNVILNPAILAGATMYLVARFDINELVQLLEGIDEIQYTLMVPTMVTALLNHPKRDQLKLDEKLKMLGTGAAPMPVEMIYAVKDLGISYREGWGMTETASAGTSTPMYGKKKVGSVGIPLPDIDYKIVALDDPSKEMGPNEPGELIVRGPNIMTGYWNNPEETANQLKDGWLFTGDIATRDEDYFIYIVDRKKDMIIAGGYNIYPAKWTKCCINIRRCRRQFRWVYRTNTGARR
jgi:long-chain acyl-CoA synthetase